MELSRPNSLLTSTEEEGQRWNSGHYSQHAHEKGAKPRRDSRKRENDPTDFIPPAKVLIKQEPMSPEPEQDGDISHLCMQFIKTEAMESETDVQTSPENTSENSFAEEVAGGVGSNGGRGIPSSKVFLWNYAECLNWILNSNPFTGPYLPQIGDTAVYFRNAHEAFVNYCFNASICRFQELELPYHRYPHLEDEVLVSVSDIKYALEPVPVIHLKLIVIDKTCGELIGPELFIRLLTPFKDVYQYWYPFLALVQDSAAMSSSNSWYSNSHQIPQAHWEYWMSGRISLLSQPGLYVPTPEEWPPIGNREEVCAKLLERLVEAVNCPQLERFVTTKTFYPDKIINEIPYPISLGTIMERIKYRFYRRVESFVFDASQLVENVKQMKNKGLIEDKHDDMLFYAKMGYEMVLDFIDVDSNKTGEVLVLYETRNVSVIQIKLEPPDSDEERYTGRVTYYNDTGEQAQDDQYDPENVTPYTWQARSKDSLDKIWKNNLSIPFKDVAALKEYPDYFQHIQQPINLKVIRKRLEMGLYNTPHDLRDDMYLIHTNARKYNNFANTMGYPERIPILQFEEVWKFEMEFIFGVSADCHYPVPMNFPRAVADERVQNLIHQFSEVSINGNDLKTWSGA